MTEEHDFDVKWRPDSCLVPSDPFEIILRGVRTRGRRARLLDALRSGDYDQVDRLLRIREPLPRDAAEQGARDPEWAGAHLPEPHHTEVDVVRIEFEVAPSNVMCVRIRPRFQGWLLQTVDESGRHFDAPRSWFAKPLTFGQLIRYIDSVRTHSGRPGLVYGELRDHVAQAGSLEKAFGPHAANPVRVHSPFYPRLGEWYERGVRELLESEEFRDFEAHLPPNELARKLQRALEDCMGDRAPEREDLGLVRNGRLDWDGALPLCEFVAESGEAEEVIQLLADFEADLRQVPDGNAEFALVMGYACVGLGRFEFGHEMYLRALALEPTDREVLHMLHNNLGHVLALLGRPGSAAEHCRMAIAIDPEPPQPWRNLALALGGLGQPVDAARALVCAILRCPGDFKARAHLDDLMEEHRGLILAEVPEVRYLTGECGGRGTRGLEDPGTAA